MAEFDDKLKQAIERGQQQALTNSKIERQIQLTEDEYKRKHTECRLTICDKIEELLKKVVDHVPGFEYETVYGSKGWGGAISRDDVQIAAGTRSQLFSRLEIIVRPFSDVHVVDLNAKGTIRNQEVYTRNCFETIDAIQIGHFLDLIDQWVLDYVEQYSID